MKAIFLTQSGTLGLFHGLQQTMAQSHGLERAGYFVADSRYFDRFVVENSGFSGTGRRCWSRSGRYSPGPNREGREPGPRPPGRPGAAPGASHPVERPGGGPQGVPGDKVHLFPGLCAPRFSHERMLGLVDAMAEALEGLFDEVQPDFVAGFICVTLGDYLGWRIAANQGHTLSQPAGPPGWTTTSSPVRACWNLPSLPAEGL